MLYNFDVCACLRKQKLFLRWHVCGSEALRIIPAGIVCAEASVGRVLVDAGYRRRGLCRRLMHEALQHIALTWGPQPVRISAQEYLAGFYASLGFEAVSGTYLEAGIPHVRMLRR